MSGENGKSNGAYEVGYRRPPRKTQFSKGKSGNPNGRPKARQSLHEKLAEEFERRVTVEHNGRGRKISKRDALVTKAIDQAIAGKPQLLKTLIETMEPLFGRLEASQSTKETSTALERVRKKLELLAQRLPPQEEVDLSRPEDHP